MHYRRMTPPTSTKSLNPYAAVYTPLSSRDAPPPSFHRYPPPPAPLYVLPFSSTYGASQNYLRPQYYSSYQNPVAPNPPPKMEADVAGKRRSFDLKRRCKAIERFPTNETKITSTRFIKEDRIRHQVVPLKRNEENTTIMIKNIPYDCTRKQLISILDDFCLAENNKAKNYEGTSRNEEVVTFAYDFIYLPIDFRSKRGKGYAFVNFTNAAAVWKFFDAFHLTSRHFIRGLNWSKKIEIVCARLQGKEALVDHFRGSVFECETDEFLPALFGPARDGSGQPVEMTVVGNRLAPPARYNRRPKPYFS